MEDPMGGGGGELRSEVPGRAMWADGQHTEGSRLRAKGLSRALAKALLLCVTASSLIGGEREALADTLTIESLSQPAPLSSSAEPGPSPSSPQSPNPMEIIHSVSNPHMPHMPSLHLSTSPPHDPSAPQHAGAPAPHKHSGHKPAHTLNWSQLSEEEKAAAKELGFKKSSWDHDRHVDSEDKPFKELSKKQKTAVHLLGYTTGDWDKVAKKAHQAKKAKPQKTSTTTTDDPLHLKRHSEPNTCKPGGFWTLNGSLIKSRKNCTFLQTIPGFN